eukprot:scaffold4733_cov170-Alexandrium_tamarense.AAC.59
MTLEWTRERDEAGTANNGDEDEDVGDDDVLGPSTSIYLDDTVEFIVERIHECGGFGMVSVGGLDVRCNNSVGRKVNEEANTINVLEGYNLMTQG